MSFVSPTLLAALERQRRITEAHVIRGLSFWLSEGKPDEHPLKFVQSLGMAGNSCWWRGYAEPWKTDRATTEVLFSLLGREWTGQLLDLVRKQDSLYTMISAIPGGRQQAVVLKLDHYSKFVYPSCFSISERINEMADEDVKHLPPDVMTRLDHSLGALEQALLDKDPMMPAHLQNSHSLLQSYPETVHLLSGEKMQLLIAAAQAHMKTEIISKAVAGKGGATKRAKVDVGDL